MHDTLSSAFVTSLAITNTPLASLVAPARNEESACDNNNTLAKATGWPALLVSLPIMPCAQAVGENGPNAANIMKNKYLNISLALSVDRSVGLPLLLNA